MAQSLKPCFPTKTFPNHYSIATGLYPDNHGIVLNNFYAPKLQLPYSIGNRESVSNGDFYGGDPIWNVAKSNGIKSATLFWVGSSAPINNQQPTYWSPYSEKLPLDARIDSVINWLNLPSDSRPHLIMWYYKEPDNIGHIYGPNSPELKSEIEKLDAFINDFFTEARKLANYNDLNFIITSDHGMSSINEDKEVYLSQIIDTNDIEFYDGGNPILNLKVKHGKIDKVYEELSNNGNNIEVWKHGEVPPKYHYGNNIRTQDIIVVAKPKWSVYYSKRWYDGQGTHGYTNDFKDMHSIFYAAGPAFKKNRLHPTFTNIDIYPLVGEILKINVPNSDGDIRNVIGMLK